MGQKIDILERSFSFAVRVIAFVNHIPRTVSGNAISSQLVRAAMSVGANLEEAQAASSRKDFIQKHYIALREAREATYWLRLVEASFPDLADKAGTLRGDSRELQLILGAIIRTAKARAVQ